MMGRGGAICGALFLLLATMAGTGYSATDSADQHAAANNLFEDGNYAEALEAAQRGCEEDDLGLFGWSLVELVEAGGLIRIEHEADEVMVLAVIERESNDFVDGHDFGVAESGGEGLTELVEGSLDTFARGAVAVAALAAIALTAVDYYFQCKSCWSAQRALGAASGLRRNSDWLVAWPNST